MDDIDTFPEDDEPTPEERRKAKYYLIAYLMLLLIPITIGIVLANTGGSDNEDSSGMTTGTGDGVATTLPTDLARPNLALSATVIETSSDFNETFAGSNAIDGSIATEWSSRGDGDDAYIVIDLGSAQDITGIGFRTREMSDGTSITNTYTVTIDDGEPLGPFPGGIGMTVSDFPATGQVVRIDMDTTTSGNTGAVEIEIYGAR